eukprot:10112951-Prorocentrum_lima.AAC.1
MSKLVGPEPSMSTNKLVSKLHSEIVVVNVYPLPGDVKLAGAPWCLTRKQPIQELSKSTYVLLDRATFTM